ncbi:S41 family peptidase [Massilia sp. 9I]|uniref:S41 family peptidase n=1 Tax=Massilia sp. 9I TaxID=2653152 RepID=UPI0012F13277|nr:S41 family peptidase [Massilia sp. 9I]VXA95612.1 Peptidase S41 [Massilia sp. 9I]
MLKHVIRSALVLCMLTAGVAQAQAQVAAPAVDAKLGFDAGSHISLQALSPIQVENLAIAAKVWGFLKYHHPAVRSGQHQWDFELFRVLPELLAAKDRGGADAVLQRWIARLGPVADCNPCASLNQQDYQSLPSLGWLNDTRLLSGALRNDLNRIYRQRSGAPTQHYVAIHPQLGKPVFDSEAEYKGIAFPDAGYQLLSLFRFWNIVEYWSPYRDQVGEDWNKVLRQSIAPVALAKDRAGYERAMLALMARVNDTHTNLWSSLHVQPPVGTCRLPVLLRFIEGRAAVLAYGDEEAGAASGLQRGDLIESMDGVPVTRLIDSWRPFYAASNEAARLRDIGAGMTKGSCGPSTLTVRRDGELKEMVVPRVRSGNKRITHDRPGDTFQLIGDDIAYIKLSSIKRDDLAGYMERAAKTKGLVIDIRNYPSDFVPWILGPYFIDKPTRFARFTHADPVNPGAFKWMPEVELPLHPTGYSGKVMVLVDEMSQSRSEYTAMALRVGPRAKVIGSTTAGADGDGTWIPLPGGLRSLLSGTGVFYPDKRPTQRIGIVPDIEVKPTIAGIRAGRDEVLDAAIAEIRRSD